MLEVLEQTPRGANPLPDAAEAPAFETRVPIELLGLDPGPQTLHVNGLATGFEIPSLRAVLASDSTDPQLAPNIALTDELPPLGDAPPLPGGAAGASAY